MAKKTKKQKRASKKKSEIRKRKKSRLAQNKKYRELKKKEESLNMIVQLMEAFKGMGLDMESLMAGGEGEDEGDEGSEISEDEMMAMFSSMMEGDGGLGSLFPSEGEEDTSEEDTSEDPVES